MPQPQATKLDPIRKAAILISTLDHRVADELLDRMSDEQAALVRSVAMELDEIPEDEQQLVMREFLGADESVTDIDDSGIELDEELARKLAEGESLHHHRAAPPAPEEAPFQFLRGADTTLIAMHLHHENPQIIAVVIAHLPPRQAADLLKHFEPQLQASLLRRIAELDTADRDIVREVEKHLKMLLQDELRAAENRAIGLSTVASILTAAGESRTRLISSLTQHDQKLARQLRSPRQLHEDDLESSRDLPHETYQVTHQRYQRSAPSNQRTMQADYAVTKPDTQPSMLIGFNELTQLGDAELALVFRRSDTKLALLALAGATPEFVSRLMKQLSAREAKAFRRRIEQLGSLRLSDIEQAQAAIAATASRLLAAGEINDVPSKHIAVAV